MKRFRITADTVNGMSIIPLIRGFPKYFSNLEISFQISLCHTSSSGFPKYLLNLLNSTILEP
jgi:hypothetical protein